METPSFVPGNGAVWKAGLGLSLATATLAVTATGAIFTDSAAVGSNAFSTGTVDLSTSVATDLVSFTSPKMLPGDSIVDAVTVTNAGNVELRYAISSATTENVLAAQLDLTVWAEAAEADTAGANTTCDSTAPATVLYAAADLGSTTGVNVVGNPTQGSQTGDRTLAATVSEILCFKVALPTTTGNTFQNLSSTATFTFAGEQTANNA